MHDSYISKLEFMNYLFANLVVALLYQGKLMRYWCVLHMHKEDFETW